MNRPIGITLIALFLGWLTLAGFGNAWVILSGKFQGMSPIHGLIALVYGITALFTCVGLWGMKIWSVIALRGWMAVCLIFMVVFSIEYNAIILGGYFGAIGFSIFISIIFWLLDNYVSSKLKTVT